MGPRTFFTPLQGRMKIPSLKQTNRDEIPKSKARILWERNINSQLLSLSEPFLDFLPC